ncbi:GDSL esterase/lipase At4g10955-like [Prosopis cineraria]|uniref:GDSL esterase/lipase At4g10955-like n=1 Tax=Prosopis cineraria TaxID=364024 RepID=UPI00240F2496|nr:GDSL esterase/lipase At4g10955-like [Prosopis cineraria]
MNQMIPESGDIFHLSGPADLKSVDWNNASHRRCVLASVVQGVYVLENDRRLNRAGPKAQALPWWETFRFRLIETIQDSSDHSVFGAVFQLNSKPGNFAINSPKYLIAFRGVMLTSPTLSTDISLSIQSYFGILHNSHRLNSAVGRVQHWVAVAGGAHNVWLAGHSLGSAIALLAAKNMAARLGCHLTAYLFPKLRTGIHMVSTTVKALLIAYSQRHENRKGDYDEFSALADWLPCLFVNPSDHVSSGYIWYFEQRMKMYELGAATATLERLGTQNTIKGLLMSNKWDIESQPQHLLPSAELIINQASSTSFTEAHGIKQWWNPRLPHHSVIHRYN